MKNPYFDYYITSGFKYRTNPILKKREFHRGVDCVGQDSKVFAGIRGNVRLSEFGHYGEGNFIQIKGFILGVAFFANLFHNEKNLVKVGDKVLGDQIVAIMGSTGDSTGEHVHFEIFTYQLDADFVKKLIKKVPYYIERKRVFFDPLKLFKYLENNNIDF